MASKNQAGDAESGSRRVGDFSRALPTESVIAFNTLQPTTSGHAKHLFYPSYRSLLYSANMSSTTLSHASYGIGIICALVEEKAAMEMMLDEEHEPLEQKSGDHNSYTLGRIGKHNVVVACLPGGHQGKAAAATVAVHMM